MTVDDRFDAKWIPEPNTGCFLWTAAQDKDGYGVFHLPGRKMVKAHRHAYHRAHGVLPRDKVVCHRCDTPGCVNPDHLWLGTALDNNRDRHAKGRDARGETSGHVTKPEATPRGGNHGNAKLTEADVIEIRRRWASGEKQAAIAVDFGIGSTNVSAIVTRAAWRHVA